MKSRADNARRLPPRAKPLPPELFVVPYSAALEPIAVVRFRIVLFQGARRAGRPRGSKRPPLPEQHAACEVIRLERTLRTRYHFSPREAAGTARRAVREFFRCSDAAVGRALKRWRSQLEDTSHGRPSPFSVYLAELERLALLTDQTIESKNTP